ncbi:MAG: hypothetical protein M3Y69_06365 [Verrucomicrobiota bacterium]|nr:hypothetical protein [Verrucomicrobiota bacterium]
MRLELALQPLDDWCEFALTALFDLLAQLLFDAAPFLQITLLVLLPSLSFQIESGLA